MDTPPPEPAPSAERAGLGNVLGLAAIVGLGAAFGLAGLHRDRAEAGGRVRCGNNLRQIALAAIQYADDKRFFPHIAGLKERDGDATTSDGPRCFRALLHFNYLDDPETFVCPGDAADARRTDAAHPLSGAAKKDPRRFGWGGVDEAEGSPSPVVRAGATDEPLPQLHDLSYGWTRRLSTSFNGRYVLAADRTIQHDGRPAPFGIVGNHRDAAMMVGLDGHTSRLSKTTPPLEPAGANADLGVFWSEDDLK